MGGEFDQSYIIYTYENFIMKPTKTIKKEKRRGKEVKKNNVEGLILIKVHYMHAYKYHNGTFV
jgi:hypothetical protein